MLEKIIDKLTQIYDTSVIEGYVKVKDEILATLFEVKNLELIFPQEKDDISYGNKKEQKVTYDLIRKDGRNNAYYIYPVGETEFKNTAFEDKQIYVRVFHADGRIENTTRKISSKWGSTVLWNINSMYTKFIKDENGNKLKYSKCSNLTVYACPKRFKDTLPAEIYK